MDMSKLLLDQTAVFGSPKANASLLDDLEQRVEVLEDHTMSQKFKMSLSSPTRSSQRLSIVQKALLSDIAFVTTSIRNKVIRLNGGDSTSLHDISASDFDKSIDRDMALSDILQSIRDNLYSVSKELDISLAEDTRKSRIIDSCVIQERRNDQLESYNKQLEKKMENFRMQVWELEHKLVSLNRTHDVVKRERSTANESIDRLTVDKAKLASRVRELESHIDDKTVIVNSLNKELVYYKDRTTHLEEQNAKLSLNNSRYKNFLHDKKEEFSHVAEEA